MHGGCSEHAWSSSQFLATCDLTTQNGPYQLKLDVSGGYIEVETNIQIILQSNLKLGEFSFSQQDLVIPVNGIPLTVTRTYNSLNPDEGDFGYGWTYTLSDMDVALDETRQQQTDQFAGSLSRCQLNGLVRDYRQDQYASMKRIQWLWPGLAWSLDATEYEGALIVPVQDLAARYRFGPLVSDQLDGSQIATHLQNLFVQHGPPLFLKRDNGSPFNSQPVEEVMAQFGVLPLNNPPHFPRYNGGMEKGIRDFKVELAHRLQPEAFCPGLLDLAAEVTAQELNHRPRRCLKGRTACAVFHDEALRLHWNKRQRQTIFGLLLKKSGAMLEKTADEHHYRPALCGGSRWNPGSAARA